MKKQSDLKIFSWNSCLGLFHKIDYLRLEITVLKPDILFIQEAEISENMRKEHLKIDNYDIIYSEPKNGTKSRIAAFVKQV